MEMAQSERVFHPQVTPNRWLDVVEGDVELEGSYLNGRLFRLSRHVLGRWRVDTAIRYSLGIVLSVELYGKRRIGLRNQYSAIETNRAQLMRCYLAAPLHAASL